MTSIEDGFSRYFTRTRSLRDECQELVALKKMTQEEVDELLGKVQDDHRRGIIFNQGRPPIITGTESASSLENKLKLIQETLSNH